MALLSPVVSATANEVGNVPRMASRHEFTTDGAPRKWLHVLGATMQCPRRLPRGLRRHGESRPGLQAVTSIEAHGHLTLSCQVSVATIAAWSLGGRPDRPTTSR